MAHEIEVVDGKASFFAALTPAWHGLGTVTPDVLTADEALKTAGLDWTVSLRQMYFIDDGTPLSVPEKFVVVRDSDNKPLGAVGKGYVPFQNSDAFKFFDSVVDSGEAKYTTAGSLRGGSRVFLTAKIGDTMLLNGEDAHDVYLIISTSHDGTKALTAHTSLVRVVCQNTMTLSLQKAKTSWSLRHKTELSGRVAEARQSLGLAFAYADAFEQEVANLMQIEVTNDRFREIISASLPEQKRVKEQSITALMNIFENEPTVISAAGAGNGWGAMNAVTYWNDHVRKFRTDESRFLSVMGGAGASMRDEVRDRVLALA